MSRILQYALRGLGLARVHTGVDQVLLIGCLEADKVWRIDAVCEVHAHRANRRAVANADTDGVNHVIEIVVAALRLAKRKVAETGVDIPGIVEEHAAEVIANQRKTQLRLIEEQR